MFKTSHRQITCEAIVQSRNEESYRAVFAGLALAIVLILALSVFGCRALAPNNDEAPANSVGESISKNQRQDMDEWHALPFPGRLPSLLRQDLEKHWGELSVLTEADTPSHAIAVAERFLWIVENARAHSLSPDQEYWLAVRSRYAKRVVRAHDFGNRFVHWHRQYSEAETYTRVIAAAENIVGLLRDNIASEEWDSDERFEFETLLEEWREKLDDIREEYNFRKRDITERLTEVQARFVAEQAEHDLSEASALLQSQGRKRFNWRFLGYPRDHQGLLMVAAQRCRRVIEESRVPPLARAKATDLLEQTKRRLGRRTREKLETNKPFPPYQQYVDYPYATEEELQFLADLLDFDLDVLDQEAEEEQAPQPVASPAQVLAVPLPLIQTGNVAAGTAYGEYE